MKIRKTSRRGLFSGCPFVNTFEGAFYGSYLESIPADLFSGKLEVTTFKNAFAYCAYLSELPAELFDNCLKATTFASIFAYCIGLTGESPYTEIKVDGTTVKVHLYDRANYTSELGCSKPSSTSSCFKNCTVLSDYSDIPSGWGGN